MNAPKTLKERKNLLRDEYKRMRKSIDGKALSDSGDAICDRILSLASYRFAEYVLMYAATEFEVSIDKVAENALKKGKKVAFPRCDTEHNTMTYRIVSDLSMLSPDSYGIREPGEDLPRYDLSEKNAICFVPALLFDTKGYRLGYGKGYYDRFLGSFSGCTVGIVLDGFMIDSVPRGRYDEKVDIIVTEKKVYKTTDKV